MQKALVAAFLALSTVLAGCGVDCGDPSQVNGTYAIFANVNTYDGTNLDEFPSYGSPANGFSEWSIEWDRVSGEVAVAIDGYPYTGAGTWDPVKCGNFTLQFAGPYNDDDGASHDLDATGTYVVFGNQIEGDWDYSESWDTLDGESGTFEAQGHVAGTIVE